MNFKALTTVILLPLTTVVLNVMEFVAACFSSLSTTNFEVEPIEAEPNFYR
jgi:hypothetical protein